MSPDTRRTLEAVAREPNIDAEPFSRQLLERVLAGALSCLDPPTREKVHAEVHARLVEELEAHQEQARFEEGPP